VLALNLPASAGLVVLSEPITRLIYQGGHFSAHDTLQTAMALEAYCVGLFAYSGVKVVVPFFYALGDARTPTLVSFISVALNVSFNLAVMHTLGHFGLALGTSLSSLASFALLMTLLERRLGKGASTLPATARIGAATLVMGGVCHWVATEIVARAGTATLLARLAAVALPIAAGVATLAAVLWLLRAPELQLFTRVLRLRRRQPAG
jgi:putative peptidoglycan lipid II flippase